MNKNYCINCYIKGMGFVEIQSNIKEVLRVAMTTAMNKGALPKCPLPNIEIITPPSKELGDFSTNLAMQSARIFKMSPTKIAMEIVSCISETWIEKIDIKGAGFINFYLNSDIIYNEFLKVFQQKEHYGNLPPKDDEKIQIEYVSANPTGLLHVGHGRGAAMGSALVNLLRTAGYTVESEYYINDAGNQIDHLGESVNARYLELCGMTTVFPIDGYHGEDIKQTAKNIFTRDGKKYLARTDKERINIFKEIALQEKLAILKSDLEKFHVNFDSWYSERTLHPDLVKEAIDILCKNGNIYEKDGALWLKSTSYGDDKDRVVMRANGVPTYLASDIAYHRAKYERGFSRIINIWGADHHGYVCRIKAAMSALHYDPEKLTVLLLQMVSLYRGKEKIKMSKRTGEGVTLNELIEEVGTDAARYFFVMRSLDSQLDFDIELAKSRSNDNPVYYIQYAHARICSIFRQATKENLTISNTPNFKVLVDEAEIELMKKILAYPKEIARAALEYAPQRIAHFAYDIATLFHHFYSRCRIMGVAKTLAEARLALVSVTVHVLRHCLKIIGVSAPKYM